ncbi:MAG: integrase arm-type DNA-binding domain-containing protein, partial [Candidatus Acidiferrales bacterium]
MAVKINQRLIRNLDAPAHGNRLVWDTELKGFGLRITRTGAVSFFLNYRNAHGLQRRYKIGNAPEWTAEAARAEAAELKPKINKGFDPLAAKQQAVRAQQEASGESTFRDLAKEYQERHYGPDASPNTKRNDREMLELIILPRFGSRPVQSITTRDIEKLHADLKATKSRANRTLSLLSAMFSEGIRWKYATENPTRDVQKYYEPPRERWLGNDELARLHAALDKCRDKVAANAIRLIALTGSRRGEVLQATWDEIDLERGVWTKPSHHTKQKTIEHVPLSAAAVELLRKIKPKVATGPLFPGRDGIAA